MTLILRALAVLAAGLYSTWLIAPVLDPELDPLRSFASEYAVAERSAATTVRLADGVAGILLMVMAVISSARIRTLWHRLPGPAGEMNPAAEPDSALSSSCRWALRLFCLGLGIAGLGTVVDAMNPMICAPSVSEECALAEAAGALPTQHSVHTVSSTAAGIGFAVAMISSAWLAGRGGPHRARPTHARRLLHWSAWGGAGLILLSGVDALVPQVPTHGITQRLSMLAIAGWLVLAAGVPVPQRRRT